MTKHTPGRLRMVWFDDCQTMLRGPEFDGGKSELVAVTSGDRNEANADRLANCWNACEGMATEELAHRNMAAIIRAEQEAWDEVQVLRTQRDELLRAIGDLHTVPCRVCDGSGKSPHCRGNACDGCGGFGRIFAGGDPIEFDAAIRKAEGSK